MKYEASFGGRLFSFMQKPLTFCSYKAAWLGGKRIVINNLYDYSVVSLETLFSYKKCMISSAQRTSRGNRIDKRECIGSLCKDFEE